ncbi:hypothetical protein [Flavobacterium sp. FlaQc-48]|uniref:hypothetical protein n=1 Tax=Flavobacterium sp. FlaQc-48 TaxID=3374181 RepID=UPI00375630C1
MAKLLQSIIFGMLISLTVSCQNKQEKIMIQEQTNLPKFYWKSNLNCPPGYPVEVYMGGLEGNGSYGSLDSGTSTGLGGWGDSGRMGISM